MNMIPITSARSLRVFSGLVGGLAFLASLASAEALSGRVRDANTNRYLPNALVSIDAVGRSTTTDREGRYVLRDLAPGTYTVDVTYVGYDEVTQTVTIAANADQVADFAAGAEVLKMDAFVIEGDREGQARALQQKRTASNIVDTVSADGVGKFPDGNAAEALRRVPGISLEIDQSEGRFVVIRGVDAALNNVTLNGQSIGSPAEQGRRGLAMDSVPADLISRLVVVKAVTPDRDHNSIGGSVDIETLSPFDRAEPFAFGSASLGYDNFSGDWGAKAFSLTGGRVLGEQQRWGAVAGVSYSVKEFASQTADVGSWTDVNGYSVPVGGWDGFDYTIKRQRLGANAALEFRPKAGHEMYVRFNYNEFVDEEGRQNTSYDFARGTLSNQTATSGDYSQGRATREYRDYKQNHTIDALAVGGSHELASDWTLEWQLGTSGAERETPRRVDWEFRSSTSAFPSSYDTSGDVFLIKPDAPFLDPTLYPFRRARFRTDIEQEDVTTAQVDLSRPITLFGREASVKFGGKYMNSDKHQDRSNTNYVLAAGAANAFTLGEPGLAGVGPTDFVDGRFNFGPIINLSALQDYFQANPQRFTYDAASSAENSTEADFDATEEVWSGYAMSEIKTSRRTSVLGGLRVEYTDATYSANQLRDGVYAPIELGNAYTEVMPGLHFNFRPNDRVVLRAAWTNTYGRTNYTDLAPRNAVEDDEVTPGVYQGSLKAGNPELEPLESMNFDLSAEYYFANNGVFSVGAFHKMIDNPVYTNSYVLTDTTFQGRFYERLSVSRPENAEEGRITGVEFNWQQFFPGLPSPFDGLGVNFNYTVTDSSATIFGRADKLPFFKQSDEIANIALLYEKYGIEFRVAYSLNSDYLASVGATSDEDGYRASREVIDAKVSYRIHPRMRLFAEMTNITEEPLSSYQGVESHVAGYEIYSWMANVGVTWNL